MHASSVSEIPQRRTTDRVVRIAAVGDLHCGEEDRGAFRDQLARANGDADILILCGDLTRRGLPAEFRTVIGEMADVKIPIAAVLGNHDFEAGRSDEGEAILRDRGVHVLCGDPFQLNEQVGFVGTKGYMGGFGRAALTAFGEAETKAFVGVTLDEVQRLEMGLRRLATPVRVAVLHYAPILGTIMGEPEVIYPFLGCDRLAEPLDRYEATVVFHGHAHTGAFEGRTAGGIPVFNVSLPVLRKIGLDTLYYVYDVPLMQAVVARP
ncbi:MAG: metallophosphoesterase family protein [Gemmatimonadaceae bacterium]